MSQCRESENAAPKGALLDSRFRIPSFFLGIGVYRAWIEIMYANPPHPIPVIEAIGGNMQDVFLAACLLAIALLSRYLAPLYSKRWLAWAGGLAMTIATVLNCWSIVDPSVTGAVLLPATLLSSAGLALLILLWCELFGCLNSFRVALYFSASLILGWFLVYFLKGLAFQQFFVAAVSLPLISVSCALRGFETLSEDSLPRKARDWHAFPWKIVLTMAAYTFAFSLFESSPSEFGGPLSSLGMLLAAAVIFSMASYFTERFRIESLFRTSLPIMAFGLFLASHFVQGLGGFSGILISASYTAFLVMLMVVMCDFVYRTGIAAIWLFGIERFVRYVVYAAGANADHILSGLLPAGTPIQSVLGFAAIALIAVTTALLLADKTLLSGADMSIETSSSSDGELRRNASIMKSEEVARNYGLTPREQEVFDLLVKGKGIVAIEKELFIANGTAKSHIQHVYKKMGVHSRKEFLEKVASEGVAIPQKTAPSDDQ